MFFPVIIFCVVNCPMGLCSLSWLLSTRRLFTSDVNTGTGKDFSLSAVGISLAITHSTPTTSAEIITERYWTRFLFCLMGCYSTRTSVCRDAHIYIIYPVNINHSLSFWVMNSELSQKNFFFFEILASWYLHYKRPIGKYTLSVSIYLSIYIPSSSPTQLWFSF